MPTSPAPRWPQLPRHEEWRPTLETLQLWTQIAGKLRLAQSPWINHSWHVTLYLTARGLTTSPIPHGARHFQLDFDLVDHHLVLSVSTGELARIALRPRSVADLYRELRERLRALGLPVSIHATPNEVEQPIPFAEDEVHRAYQPEQARLLHGALLQAHRVLTEFRARFVGKCSPVHFFWGGFDLAVTRFSGRLAPPHPGGVPHLPTWVAREAYSHEVSSCGFWPGGPATPVALFYAYAYPEPRGFREARVGEGARYDESLREFVLPYDRVREADDPDLALLSFLQATYEAAADLGGWDRRHLERDA